MLKKIVLICALLSAVGVAALGKDGPFPMLEAVGRWQAQSFQKFYVDISVRPVSGGKKYAEVFVVVRDQNGVVTSQGSTVHKLSKKNLEVVLRDHAGYTQRLTIRAMYLAGKGESKEPEAPRLSLSMDMKTTGSRGILFNRYRLDRSRP
jgi:hypothetical protein